MSNIEVTLENAAKGSYQVVVYGNTESPFVGSFVDALDLYVKLCEVQFEMYKTVEDLDGYATNGGVDIAFMEQVIVALWPTFPKTLVRQTDPKFHFHKDVLRDLSIVVTYFRTGDRTLYESSLNDTSEFIVEPEILIRDSLEQTALFDMYLECEWVSDDSTEEPEEIIISSDTIAAEATS